MKSWKLYKNTACLGLLRLKHTDQPFIHCAFEPTEEFAVWRPIFEHCLRLGEQENISDTDWLEANRIYDEELEPGLELIDIETNQKITELLLHIYGDEAWFRY